MSRNIQFAFIDHAESPTSCQLILSAMILQNGSMSKAPKDWTILETTNMKLIKITNLSKNIQFSVHLLHLESTLFTTLGEISLVNLSGIRLGSNQRWREIWHYNLSTKKQASIIITAFIWHDYIFCELFKWSEKVVCQICLRIRFMRLICIIYTPDINNACVFEWNTFLIYDRMYHVTIWM